MRTLAELHITVDVDGYLHKRAELLDFRLRRFGRLGAAKVLEAGDGIEGLRMAFGDLVPDLVICDPNTEPLDGLAVVGASVGVNLLRGPIVSARDLGGPIQ